MITSNKGALFFLVGGWNTLFGYLLMVLLYEALSLKMHIAIIAIIANVLSITMAFLTYKLIVFRTKGCWLVEYLKCYLVYGGLAILSVLVNWLCNAWFGLSVWISQGLCILIGVLISYFGHSYFTFKKNFFRG